MENKITTRIGRILDEIKFRGKHYKNGEWVYGDLARRGVEHVSIRPFYEQPIGVNPSTVGQYTRMKDRNGKEIYEGDIISVCGKYNRVVEWCGLGWGIIPVENFYDEDGWRKMMVQQPDIKWWNDHKDRIEIIGNIYDNPELLKGVAI